MENVRVKLKVSRKKGKTILESNKGGKWKIPHVDDETAIATLVFYTLKNQFDKISCFSEDFEIEITMSRVIHDGE